MKTLPHRLFAAALLATVLYLPAARAAISITAGSTATHQSGKELSGITWAGGNLYYAVEDQEGALYPLTIGVTSSGGITCSVGTPVTLSGASDLEGCAWDPAAGTVWVSMESSSTPIREYNPTTGELLRTAPVPQIMISQRRGNYSLEALTISSDGLTMWTCNEESLTCDGDRSTTSAGTYVRLTRFTRASVRGNWVANGQWAYLTDPLRSDSSLASTPRSGVSGLCSLPDGTLLVLEREFSGISFRLRYYRVDFTNADNIETVTAFDASTYSTVAKTKIYESSGGMANYEGLCLGPWTGNNTAAIVAIADGGGGASAYVQHLKLSGLDIKTVSYTGPEGCEPVGGPYRYVSGSTVTASLSETGNPYEANTVAHAAWSAPANNASGNGSTVSFTVTADDTFSWSWVTNAALPLVATDSFERYAANTEPDAMEGWSGDGFVSAASYSPAVPAGYPLQLESHTKILVVDGDVERDYSAAAGTGTMLDTMVRVTREIAENPVTDVDNCQVALYFDTNGRPTLQHASAADGTTLLRTTLSEHTFANDDWVRASLIFATNTAGAAWCQVRLDGEPCVTSAGVRSPSSPVSPGSWHRALGGGVTAGRISSVSLQGSGAVDDVALYGAAAQPSALEFDTSAGTSTNGVPYAWLSDHGLPWNTTLDLDGDGFDSASEWTAGTDPLDAHSFPRNQLFLFLQ